MRYGVMDYIRKEDAINAMEEAINNKTWSMSDRDVIESMEEYVEALPTADVSEVKHGKWIDKYGNKYANHLYECSVCGKEALYEVGSDALGHTQIRQALTPACPYCFAKMDGKEE